MTWIRGLLTALLLGYACAIFSATRSKHWATQPAVKRQAKLQECSRRGGSLCKLRSHLAGPQFTLPPALGSHTTMTWNRGDNGYKRAS